MIDSLDLTKTIFDEINISNDLVMDFDGSAYSARDYMKKYYNGMRRQFDRGVIPKAYEHPTGAQLELTYRCNQKCRHCYNQSGGDNSNNPSLSLEDWKRIAHELGELGIFQCVISGGEPTLMGEGLFEIMDILHSYNVKFIIITNGMLIDKEKINRLKKYKYSWFQVSIDGSRPELHDYVRGVESWEKAVNAANLVVEAGLPLVIAHAVVKKNLDYLEEMIDMAYLLGAVKITTGPFSYMGRAVLNSNELELTEDEKKKVYEVSNKKAAEYKGRLQVGISSEEAISLRMKLIEPNGVMLIRPNGDVKFDCVAPFKIGNVLNEDIQDIWDKVGRNVWSNPRMIEYVNSIKSSRDLLTVKPRINVDEDELLEPFERSL